MTPGIPGRATPPADSPDRTDPDRTDPERTASADSPDRAAPADSTGSSRTAPRARISLSALRLNLRAVLASTAHGVIDVRADAWGHGIDAVGPMALDAGATALLVDEAGARRMSGIVESERLTLHGAADAPDAVYGLSPGFAPALSLRGRVLSLKPLRAGEGVSYGYTFRAQRDTTVALVTGGYAQGIVRALGNSARVQIAGSRHPIVGRVAMDACVVDVGAAERPVARGDAVDFFGDPAQGACGISDWTAATGMTAGELVTAVGLRNAREYVA